MSRSQTNSISNENGDVNVNQDFSKNKYVDKSKTTIRGRDSGTRIGIKISIAFVTIIALFYIMVAITNTPEKKIIGTWQINEQPHIYVTFGENGMFSMSGAGDYLDGTYAFLSDNTVQARMNYLWADFVLSGDISIIGNNMTIRNMSDPDDIFNVNGMTLTLKKTK